MRFDSKKLLKIVSTLFIISILFMIYTFREMNSRHEEEMIKVIASEVYDDINSELLKPIMVSQAMANDLFLHQNLQMESTIPEDQETELMKNYLKTIKDRFGYSAAFLVTESSKNYWQPSGLVKKMDLENDPHDIWYKDFVAKDVSYAFNVDTDEANKLSLTVFVNTRIKDNDGNLLGVCGVGVSMSGLQKILETDEKNYNIKINLVDKNGLVQVDTESINIENSTLTNILSNQRTENFFVNKINDKFVLTKYIPEFDWYLVIEQRF